MFAKVVCISFLILGVFLTHYCPGVEANYGDSTSSVNSKNDANANNRDTTYIRVNDGSDQGNRYRGCGYYNYPCYGK